MTSRVETSVVAEESRAKSIAEYVRARREALGLTQESLGSALNRDGAWVARLEEGGITLPDPEMILRVADVLEVKPVQLLRAASYPVSEQHASDAGYAGLLALEREAREQAETAAARLTRLQTVTSALSRAIGPAQVADVVVTQGVAACLADSGSIYQLTEDGSRLEMMAAVGYPPNILEAFQQIPIDAPVPLAQVARDGEPLWVESSQEWDRRFPSMSQVHSHTQNEAAIAFPLTVDGRTLGVIGLSFQEPRHFEEDERIFLLILAQQCAQALDRARLYAAEQKARVDYATFLAAIAHDLKAPLATVKGTAQLLEHRAERPGPAEPHRLLEGLGQIDRLTSKMGGIVDGLLDLTRLHMDRPLDLNRASIDLVALARQSVAEHQLTTTKHRIVLRTDLPELVGSWDAARLERVLGNLLSNASRYSPEGGDIVVALDVETEGSCRWAVLRVTDQGIGIDQADQPHIFEQFYRGGNVRGRIAGAGIGLAGACQIVEQHGGTISVESRLEEGSTFVVRLPLSLLEETAAPD